MKEFRSPQDSFNDLDAEATGALIAAANDVALIVDSEGIIRDLAFGSDDLSREGHTSWLGRRWADTVTIDSRSKVEAMLRDAALSEGPTWRHINHPSSTGTDIPMLYSTVRVGDGGRTIAVGRDLRAVANLQQRLIDAQQSIERDHWRLRQLETRYRVLFQMASEPILVVDATTRKIVEANNAAAAVIGPAGQNLIGRTFPDGFDAATSEAIVVMLAQVRAGGRSEEIRGRPTDGSEDLVVSASLVRTDNAPVFLIRVAQPNPSFPGRALPPAKSMLLSVIENGPDALVVTDPEGQILSANRAFLELVQVAGEDDVVDQSLGTWLGQHGLDFTVLMANLRRHETVRLFASSLRDAYGSATEVEISAVAVPHGELPCIGFMIRQTSQRVTALEATPSPRRELPRSIDQLSELVGRVPLKDLVREATDVIERLCIEAALELTRDNRASAAEMLGLSRQSLYVKLRRYGLADLGAESDPPE